MDSAAFDIVYGVVGLKAAGKGEFGDRMAGAGFTTYTLSAPIKAATERQMGSKYDVFDLMRVADAEREKHGSGYWAGETLLLASRADHRKVVIDGIRNPGEIRRLRELLGYRLVLVGITAPTELRFQRMVKRGKPSDPKDLQGFLTMDDKDRGIGQPDTGQQVDRCLAEVPYENLFDNRGSLQDFHAWIDAVHSRASGSVHALALDDAKHYID